MSQNNKEQRFMRRVQHRRTDRQTSRTAIGSFKKNSKNECAIQPILVLLSEWLLTKMEKM